MNELLTWNAMKLHSVIVQSDKFDTTLTSVEDLFSGYRVQGIGNGECDNDDEKREQVKNEVASLLVLMSARERESLLNRVCELPRWAQLRFEDTNQKCS